MEFAITPKCDDYYLIENKMKFMNFWTFWYFYFQYNLICFTLNFFCFRNTKNGDTGLKW